MGRATGEGKRGDYNDEQAGDTLLDFGCGGMIYRSVQIDCPWITRTFWLHGWARCCVAGRLKGMTMLRAGALHRIPPAHP